MSRKEAQTPDAPIDDLDKQVVRLPDGRELTYYRFPHPPAGPAPARPPARKER